METKTIRGRMSSREDVHGCEGRFQAAWRLAVGDLSPEDLSLVGRFIDSCRAEGLSASRCTVYLYKLRGIRRFLGKGFSGADRSDVERVLAEIYGQGYRPWTVHLYKVALKKFYRWLREAERDPPEVAWIRTSLKDNEKILPEDILTPEEIKRMVKVAHSLRDKTYVETGYEGGFRPGEMLTLRIRSVEFDLYGAVITVRGKTGSRRVRTVESSPRLQTWMENHPHRDDPDAWLWVNIGNTNQRKRLSYPSVRKMLRTIATRAKILKRVNPYSFRHARATHLAKVLTEAQMCNFFGWKIGSKTPSVYVHLSGRDLDPPLLAHYGLKKKEELESGINPRRCPRCEALNSHDAKYCRKCSMILDPEEALRVENKRQNLEKKVEDLLKRLENLEKLRV